MVVGLTAGAPLLLKALLVLVQNVFRVVHGHKGAAETVMPDALVRVVCKSKQLKPGFTTYYHPQTQLNFKVTCTLLLQQVT